MKVQDCSSIQVGGGGGWERNSSQRDHLGRIFQDTNGKRGLGEDYRSVATWESGLRHPAIQRRKGRE